MNSAMPRSNISKKDRDNIELLVSLLKFAALVSRPMRDGVADPAGLSSNELRILMALSGEGEAAGHDLAELMGMNPMNVSRALASLRQMDLAEPATNEMNRRRKPYRVSRKGDQTYDRIKPRIADVANHLFDTLDAGERASLGKLLQKLEQQVLDWQPEEAHPRVRRA
jgi:DNA-binding MarR family transcriptional regulator